MSKETLDEKEKQQQSAEKEQEIKDNKEKSGEKESAKAEEITDSAQAEAESDLDEPEGELESEKTELEKVTEELQKLKNQHLRLYADFENHKKRTAKERMELFTTANREMMEAMLPVLDDFKRALPNIEDKKAREGVELIYSKFNNVLQQKGLKPMESAKGKEFDVETMEAITKIPAPTKKEKGKVVDEVEQGYYLGDKIIRYAKVVIGE